MDDTAVAEEGLARTSGTAATIRLCAKAAGVSGLTGLVAMYALWRTGLPPRHLWLLAFWPSQAVGLGTDGVQVVPEMALQFGIYAVIGFALALTTKALGGLSSGR